MTKRVLVTGGAGFLGSHLCEKLLAKGSQVICVDNLFTGSLENLTNCLAHPAFTYLEHDVCLPIDCEVEEIYNLACPASPIHYQHDPVKTIKTSVYGMIHVLELAVRCQAKVLQASTSEVYGDPQEHPQRETYWGHVNPVGIRSCYDEGKRCAETLCFDFHRQFSVPVKIARIFNTYGPRMHPHDGRVVSNFIVQALLNQPITVYGQGEQTRSFCYYEDLLDGLMALMDSKEGFTGPVNLGNPTEFTIRQLAMLVLELTGSSSPLVFHPLPGDDPKQRKPDIDLAVRELAFAPKTSLREGLIETIEYFRSLSLQAL